MLVQTYTFFPSIILPKAPFAFSGSNSLIRKQNKRRAVISSSLGQDSTGESGRKRKVVEHICLLKAKDDLDDEREHLMLDYLYTTQYQMGGIVAVSLGRVSDQNPENYTHAFYMRFQSKRDLENFYGNTFYLGVLKDYVMPYCHALINVDYETEIEDDILSIFRKGEDFNFGVELIILIEFFESAMGRPVDDGLTSFIELTENFPTLIVQATQGSNFNPTSKEYTHGVMIKFRSREASEIFMGSSEYKDARIHFISQHFMHDYNPRTFGISTKPTAIRHTTKIRRYKFQTITRKILSVHFDVNPVGTELM